VVGNVCVGRQGLGIGHVQGWKGANATERIHVVQEEIRQSEEETRKVKSMEVGSQGA